MPHHPLDDLTPLTWAPMTPDDASEFIDLLTAIEHLDDSIERHSAEDVLEQFENDRDHLEYNTLLGRDRGGSPAAWAWNRKFVGDKNPVRVWLRGGVHPVWRSQQIGRHLFEWQLQQARDWYRRDVQPGDGRLRLIAWADEKMTSHAKLLESAGLTPSRWYVDMVRADLMDVAELHVPDGVRLVPLTPARHESVRQAHNEAFETEWGAEPVAPEAWRRTLTRPTARPQWSWVAVNAANEDEVVGYAVCSAFETGTGTCGWIDHLGVRRDWRARGVATAVVTAALRTFADQGLSGAGLGVDVAERQHALGLYQRLGYEAADTMVLYVRDEESADGRSLEMGHHQA